MFVQIRLEIDMLVETFEILQGSIVRFFEIYFHSMGFFKGMMLLTFTMLLSSAWFVLRQAVLEIEAEGTEEVCTPPDPSDVLEGGGALFFLSLIFPAGIIMACLVFLVGCFIFMRRKFPSLLKLA